MLSLSDLLLEELHTLRKSWEGVEEGLEEQRIMGKVNKDELVDRFVYQLPILRAVLDMSQDDVGEIVGLSRQTYSSIETRRRRMTWSNYMALLFFFYYNPATKEAVENAGIFPEELKEAMVTDLRRNS